MSAEHEMTLLAQVFIQDKILNETSVKAEFFTDHKMAKIFGAMVEMNDRNVKPDIVNIHDSVPEVDVGFIANITSVSASTSNWKYYDGVIVDQWKRRKLHDIGMMLTEAEGANDEIIEEAEKGILQIQESGGRQAVVKVGSAIAEHMKTIDDQYRNRGRLPGIATGFAKLDKMTMGLRDRLLYVIGGRPSEGKSALTLNMAQHIAVDSGISVGYISIESSRKEMMNRMLATRARINGEQILSGYLTEENMDKIMDVYRMIYEAPLYIWDQPNATISDVKSVSRSMKRHNGIKVLFVDYLQLIHIPGKDERKDVVAESSMALKALARELGIPVVVAAQLGRDADNRRPGMGDFQWSSQIEQDADVAILLWNQGREDDGDEKSSFLVEKCRDGRRGKIPVRFERSFISFTEEVECEGY